MTALKGLRQLLHCAERNGGVTMLLATCKHCGGENQVGEHLANKRTKCVHCGQVFRVLVAGRVRGTGRKSMIPWAIAFGVGSLALSYYIAYDKYGDSLGQNSVQSSIEKRRRAASNIPAMYRDPRNTYAGRSMGAIDARADEPIVRGVVERYTTAAIHADGRALLESLNVRRLMASMQDLELFPVPANADEERELAKVMHGMIQENRKVMQASPLGWKSVDLISVRLAPRIIR